MRAAGARGLGNPGASPLAAIEPRPLSMGGLDRRSRRGYTVFSPEIVQHDATALCAEVEDSSAPCPGWQGHWPLVLRRRGDVRTRLANREVGSVHVMERGPIQRHRTIMRRGNSAAATHLVHRGTHGEMEGGNGKQNCQERNKDASRNRSAANGHFTMPASCPRALSS